MTRIAYIGTYVPQKCGIATYTHHLRQSVSQAKRWKGKDPVIAVKTAVQDTVPKDPADGVIIELEKNNREAYTRLAERLNANRNVDVVSLQHEFGIFGGEAGEYILDFVERLEKPLAVTFHTIFEHPQEPYRSVQERIAKRSDLILVMNRMAGTYLHQAFGIPMTRIRHVPHGTPLPAPQRREDFRRAMGWDGRQVLMSFGLLSRSKGLETVLHALKDVVKAVPDVLYAIVGQTHPEVRKQEGESYREELLKTIHRFGLARHVTMVDRYVEEDELVGLLSACDLYVTPYPGMQQITSGTLAYAIGLGRPVLSTPYAYAKDLLGEFPELLLPPGDSKAWMERICAILTDDEELQRIGQGMERLGADMHWPEVGRLHLELFRQLPAGIPMLQAN